MKIEVRADGAHISGYVNVTGKKSRPVITPHGKCVEMIEERTFEKAIKASGNITVNVDHDDTHIYASTEENTLKLYEDNIGLHADVLITDKDVIELAKKGKIRGWSFGMYNVKDEMEDRANDLPIRHIKGMELDHIALVIRKIPVYAATSVEVRAEGKERYMENRAAVESAIDLKVEDIPKKIDYTDFETRIANL